VIALRMQTKFMQPSIEVLNIRIDEPVTTITDLLLVAICIYAFIVLRKSCKSGIYTRYFRSYFLVLGLGALTGGLLGHAFQYMLSEKWKLLSWILTLGSVVLMVQALLEVARPLLSRRSIRLISGLNYIVAIPVLIITIGSLDFSPVKFYAIFGLVGLAGSLSFYIYHRTGNRGVLVLMGGVGIGFISAIIYSLEWGFSAWFNHRDLGHIILCFGAYYIYRGAERIINSVVSPG
jgi:hypothetical protein